MMVFSIIFEQIGTGFLEACQAFTKLPSTICLILAYIVSYWLFAKALEKINLSVFYATWGAIGTAATPIIGYIAYQQRTTKLGVFALVLIMVCVVVLNLYG